MLVPGPTPNDTPAEFQTVLITLPVGLPEARIRTHHDCAIEGDLFSMHSSPNSDNRSWIIQSPSTSGWGALREEMNGDAQWKQFIRELARLHDHGCFPTSLSTQSIRSAIAEKIPLPADRVPVFMFSERGERFVNLAPGMEIRIQKVLSKITSVSPGSRISLPMLTVDYDVVPRSGGGIGLRLSQHANGGPSAFHETEDRQILTLGQRFAPTPVLRLFLQGLSEKNQGKSEFAPILIGASDARRLDFLTDLVRQRDSAACVSQPDAICVDLPAGSVSLSSIIWINGHRTVSAFGTSLASQLFRLPEQEQAEALKSVRVIRKLRLGHYAAIQFPRTVDGASQLLLLPGDRIEWRD